MPVGVVTSGLVRRYSLVLQTCLGEGSILVELVVLRHVERLWLVTRSLVVVVVRDESTSNGGQCHCLRLTSSPLTVVRSFVRSIVALPSGPLTRCSPHPIGGGCRLGVRYRESH